MSDSTMTQESSVSTLEFVRTRDWWVDFGLVNLHQQIGIREDLCNKFGIRFCSLSQESPNCYSITGSKDDIKDFLTQLKDDIVAEHYANYKSGKTNYYLDNQTLLPILYDKTSVQLHLKKFFGGILSTPARRTSYFNLTTYQQDALRRFFDENKEDLDPADIKRAEAKDDKLFVGELKFDISWKPDIEGGSRICCLSGHGFCKLEDAKGYHYPAIVTSDKMQTFYSGLKGKLKMGAPYALACIMAPLNMRYIRIDSKGTDFTYVYFIPVANTLYWLSRIQMSWVPPEIIDPEKLKFRNFDTDEIYTSYLNESVLAYLLAMYSRVQPIGLDGPPDYESELEDMDIDIPLMSERISIMAFTDSEFNEFRGVQDFFCATCKNGR